MNCMNDYNFEVFGGEGRGCIPEARSLIVRAISFGIQSWLGQKSKAR